MHLMESASRKLTFVPFVHEVAGDIAAEDLNELGGGKKAVVLVTAGPGLTNVVTAMAGAFLESREILVHGGQVKTADLSRGKLRQRGIQEIDGLSIVRLSASPAPDGAPMTKAAFTALCETGSVGRKGPVFIKSRWTCRRAMSIPQRKKARLRPLLFRARHRNPNFQISWRICVPPSARCCCWAAALIAR